LLPKPARHGWPTAPRMRTSAYTLIVSERHQISLRRCNRDVQHAPQQRLHADEPHGVWPLVVRGWRRRAIGECLLQKTRRTSATQLEVVATPDSSGKVVRLARSPVRWTGLPCCSRRTAPSLLTSRVALGEVASAYRNVPIHSRISGRSIRPE